MSGAVRNGRAAWGRIGLPLALVLSLSACGGGGSASSTTGSSSGTGTPSGPSSVYTGSVAQGLIDGVDALEYAQQAGAAINMVDQLGRSFVTALPPQNYAQTLDGSISGTLVMSGTIAADGSGVVTETYSDYESSDAPGVVQNGTFVVSQNKGSASSGTLSFNDFTETANGTTFLFSGDIKYSLGGSAGNLVANLLVSSSTFQVKMSGLTVGLNPEFAAVSAFGRVYVSNLGYVDVSTPSTVWLNSGNDVVGGFADIFPAVGAGELVLTGAHGAVLHDQPLTDYFAYLGFDTNGDGKIAFGTRIDRSTGEIDAQQLTGTSVEAMVELPSAVTATSPVTVDGRFSYAPNDFVNYSWKLLVAPPGSAVQITSSEPVVHFTPDVPGSYVVQLTATSSEGKSAIDTQTINAIDSPSPGTLFAPYGSPATSFKVPSYIDGTVNQAVTLDGRASPNARTISASQGNVWALHTPPGSHAVIADPTAVLTSFTPDVPGIYFVTLGSLVSSHFNSYFSPAAVSVIGVDEPVRFAAPAIFPSYTNYSVMAAGTFTAGGGQGIALGFAADSNHPDPYVLTLQPGVNGDFGSPGNVTLASSAFTAFSNPQLATPDLDGNGVSDLVADAGCAVDFQESGNSYSVSTQSLASACVYPFNVDMIRSGEIGGHSAVVAVAPDYSGGEGFAAFLTDSIGTVQAPVFSSIHSVNPGDAIESMALQDVDGDGEADLVMTVRYGPPYTYGIQIYHGNGDGTFTYVSGSALTGSPATYFPLAVGDFNGDGKTDFAVVDGRTLDLFYGDGHGGIASSDTRALSCETRNLDALDLNHDGHPDLMVGSTGCSSDPVYYNQLGMFLSASDGTLGQEQFYPVVSDAAPNAKLFMGNHVLADIDGDGSPDLYIDSTVYGLASMLQLPAVTSATLSLTRRTMGEEVFSAMKQTAASRPDSIKLMLGLRVHPPKP